MDAWDPGLVSMVMFGASASQLFSIFFLFSTSVISALDYFLSSAYFRFDFLFLS